MKTRAAAVLALVALGYIVLGINRGLSIYDEAIPLVAAMRILDGDRPYRDFWIIYPPGQPYLLVGAFKIFGASLLVSRLTSAAAIFATSIMMYVLGRQLLLPAPLAVLAAGVWTVVVGAIAGATLSTGVFTALALGMASAASLLRSVRDRRRGPLVTSGFVLGLAFLFRHDIAGYFLVAEAIFLAATAARPGQRGIAHALTPLGGYLAVMALPVLAAVVLLLAFGVPAGDLVEDLVSYPFTSYAATRSLPLPPLVPDTGPLREGRMSIAQYATGLRAGLRFYFPVAVFAIAVSVLLARHRGGSGESSHGETRPVAFVWLIGVSVLPYAWVRSDLAHVVPAWFPALLLFAWLVRHLPEHGKWRAAGLALAAGWTLIFVWGALASKAGALAATGEPTGPTFDLPRAAHIVVGTETAPMQAAIRYVRTVVPPDEPIFVGNAQHDNLVLNDMMFYFLADRRSGTKYQELVPGVATTAAVQARIVQDLNTRRVRHVVLRADPGYVPSSAGAVVLDRFIRERFERVETFQNYSVWRRREDKP